MMAAQTQPGARDWCLLFVCLCLHLAFGGRAQLAARRPQDPSRPSQSPVPTFRTGTTLVQLDAVVRGRDGSFADDLTPDDFVVLDDGQPHPVETLYVVTGKQVRAVAPTTDGVPVLGSPVVSQRIFLFVFDLYHMRAGRVARARQAALEFVEHGFRPGDIAGVVSNGTLANNRLTADAVEVANAIRAVRPTGESDAFQREMQDWPTMTEAEAVQIEREAGGIDHPMRDAIVGAACSASMDACDPLTVGLVESKARYLAGSARSWARNPLITLASLGRELGRLPGRKTVLFFSDGFASEETEADIRTVIGEAARSSVVIYTLDTRGLDRGTASSDIITGVVPKAGGYGALTREMMLDAGQDAPMRLAADTGGFGIRNENDFSRALREIADDTSSYYVLGYRQTHATFDGKLHHVTVRVKRPGLTTRARRSYVALEPAPAHEPALTSAVAPMPSGTEYQLESPHPGPAEPLSRSQSSSPVIPTILSPTGSVATVLPGAASAVGIHLRPLDDRVTADTDRLRTSGADASARPELPPPLAEQARAGWAAYERGDTKAAREALAGPAAHEAAPPWVHYVLGWAAFAEGGYDQSRIEWTIVRAQVPDFQPVYFDIADACLRDRKTRDALVTMQDAERRWPLSVDVLNAVGVVLTSLGDLDQAIVTFERARKAAPDNAEAAFNLAAASEIRYVASIRPNGAAETDRSRAVEEYRAVLGFGGTLADSSREGLRRLEPLDVTRVTCSAPARIASLGRSQLNGMPSQLAWSADGRYIYVGAVVPAYGSEEHFVLTVADGHVTTLTGRPDWADAYWKWKAAQYAPWLPAVRINAETKRMTAFNSVDGGDVNRAYAPAGGQSMSNVLTLHGQTIGEASSGAVVAGMTFGWAPFAMGAVAFADPRGHLVLMDVEGRKLRVEGTSDVRLPAWSFDARQVAYLRREGNAHVVYVVQVSGR